MTDPLPTDCAGTQARSSLFLDGRLPAKVRRQVQDHLRGCTTCLAVFRDLGQLSRATHNLPGRRAPADLACAVRQAALAPSFRRRTAPRQRVLAAAGVALLAGTWWCGYWIGGLGSPDAADDTVLVPPSTQAPREAVPDPGFAAAGRTVLDDLMWIEDVPERGRRALIGAQLAYFDLGDRADRLLDGPPNTEGEVRQLAHFLRRLAATIQTGDQIQWSRWRERARGFRRLAARTPGPRRSLRTPDLVELRGICDRFAADLAETERADLAELVQWKRGLLDGRVAATLAAADRWRRPQEPSSTQHLFELPARVVTAQSLAVAGLDTQARNLFADLHARFATPKLEGGDPALAPTRSPDAAAVLQRMMHDLGMFDSGLKVPDPPGDRR